MIGFRLERKNNFNTNIIARVMSLLLATFITTGIFLNDESSSLSDKEYKVILTVLVCCIMALVVTTGICACLYELFDSCYVKYYISEESTVEYDDARFLVMLTFIGEIPFLPDNYIDTLGYKVKSVKIGEKEYNSIQSMINAKKMTEERYSIDKLREQYERDGIEKIYLGK